MHGIYPEGEGKKENPMGAVMLYYGKARQRAAWLAHIQMPVKRLMVMTLTLHSHSTGLLEAVFSCVSKQPYNLSSRGA